MPPQPPRKSKQQKIDEVLESLKNRSTTEEANLSSVLKDNRKLKKFNQAPVLLSEVSSLNIYQWGKLCEHSGFSSIGEVSYVYI